MNTYITVRVQGKPPIFRHFRCVRHTEALGILDPFQREDELTLDAVSGCISHFLTFGEEV